MKPLVAAFLLGCSAFPGLSAEPPALFQYAEEGAVLLWGSELGRGEALAQVSAFRAWAKEYVSGLKTMQLAGRDDSLLGDAIGRATRALAIIPEDPKLLDRQVFEAVVDLAAVLKYYPPAPSRQTYDAYFVAYASVIAVSPKDPRLFMADVVANWDCGSRYRQASRGDVGIVCRGKDRIANCTVERVFQGQLSFRAVERNKPAAAIRKGDAVVVVSPAPDPYYERLRKRLEDFYSRRNAKAAAHEAGEAGLPRDRATRSEASGSGELIQREPVVEDDAVGGEERRSRSAG